MNFWNDMIEQITFEATGVEIAASQRRSTTVEVRADVDINELLNTIETTTIKGYLEDRGFKVEKI